ncbi:18670_t:CDS:2, partial [Racocetra fulgida]
NLDAVPVTRIHTLLHQYGSCDLVALPSLFAPFQGNVYGKFKDESCDLVTRSGYCTF